MVSPYASIQSTTSSFTVSDNTFGNGSYSVQYNLNDQANKYYLQVVLQVSAYTGCFFHPQVFAYNNSTAIEDHTYTFPTAYNPMQYNAQVIFAYDPATKVASMNLVNPSGVSIWGPTYTLTAGVVPNIADLDVLGYGNQSGATFSGFAASAQMHTRDSHLTSIYNWPDTSMAPSNLCNAQWNWSVEASNLSESSGNGSYNFSYIFAV
jgi:hypothetical protein